MAGVIVKDLLCPDPIMMCQEQNHTPAPFLQSFSSEILIYGADESLIMIISDYRLRALITLAVE